jgi:hypothetical protein
MTGVALGDRDAVGFLSKRTGAFICVAFNSPEYVIDAAVANK